MNVSVPFLRCKVFSEDYVKPMEGSFDYQYENGVLETIRWSYQPVDQLFCVSLAQLLNHKGTYQPVDQLFCVSLAHLLNYKGIKPRDVEELIFGVGGDHGQGAFRLIFKVIVKLLSGDWHEQVCGGAARIICSKDRAEIIKKAFLPQLTKDLEILSKSKVLITPLNEDGTGRLVCDLLSEGDDAFEFDQFSPLHSHIVSSIDMWNVGDLKWLCMILGMTNMEGIWCIYCYLRKQQWKVYGHAPGRERTIENMAEFLNAGLRGAERMGVVDAPWWPFIKKCMIPLLHIIIGIFNDIDQHYLKVLDEKVIAISRLTRNVLSLNLQKLRRKSKV